MQTDAAGGPRPLQPQKCVTRAVVSVRMWGVCVRVCVFVCVFPCVCVCRHLSTAGIVATARWACPRHGGGVASLEVRLLSGVGVEYVPGAAVTNVSIFFVLFVRCEVLDRSTSQGLSLKRPPHPRGCGRTGWRYRRSSRARMGSVASPPASFRLRTAGLPWQPSSGTRGSANVVINAPSACSRRSC